MLFESYVRAFKAVLQQYAEVVKGIVHRSQPSAPKIGGRRPPPAECGDAALEFLSHLIERWDHLPLSGLQRPKALKHLEPVLSPDRCYGQYHSVQVWPKHLYQTRNRNIDVVVPWIEVNLGNKVQMGLRVGLHWTEYWRQMCGSPEERARCLRHERGKNAKWSELDEMADLIRLTTIIYDQVNKTLQRGHWLAIAERLEYTRTDPGLISVLKYHRPELQQLIVSRIYEIWTFCGREVLKLNDKLLRLQGAN
jgi:hypothetical protein